MLRSAVLACALMAPTASALSASRVLVVYRSDGADANRNGISDSKELADGYAQRRGVPPANLLGLTFSLSAGYWYYSTGQYPMFLADIVTPLKQKLAALGRRTSTPSCSWAICRAK